MGWLLAFLILLASSAVFAPVAAAPLAPTEIGGFYALNIGGVIDIVFLMLFYFIAEKNRFQEKSELLLLNVLPKEIADLLKNEQRSIADHFEEAGILFADVVEFTPCRGRWNRGRWLDLLHTQAGCGKRLRLGPTYCL